MLPPNICPAETLAVKVEILAYSDGIYTIITNRPDRKRDAIYTVGTLEYKGHTIYELMDDNYRRLGQVTFDRIDARQRPHYALGWALTFVLTYEHALDVVPACKQRHVQEA